MAGVLAGWLLAAWSKGKEGGKEGTRTYLALVLWSPGLWSLSLAYKTKGRSGEKSESVSE